MNTQTQKNKILWSLKLSRRQGVLAIHSMGLIAKKKKKDLKDTISTGTHVPKVFSLQLFYTGCYHFPLEPPAVSLQPGPAQNASSRVLLLVPKLPSMQRLSGRASNTKKITFAKLNTRINLLWQQPKQFAFASRRFPAAAPFQPGQLLWQASAVATEVVHRLCLLGKEWGHTVTVPKE